MHGYCSRRHRRLSSGSAGRTGKVLRPSRVLAAAINFPSSVLHSRGGGRAVTACRGFPIVAILLAVWGRSSAVPDIGQPRLSLIFPSHLRRALHDSDPNSPTTATAQCEGQKELLVWPGRGMQMHNPPVSILSVYH